MNAVRGAVADDLPADYLLLVRHLARLQVRVSELMLAHARERERLQAEIIRLRAAQIVAATERFWAIGAYRTIEGKRTRADLKVHAPTHSRPGDPLQQARAAICQAGCQGHGHPWLSDGQCGLTGESCERLPQPG